MADCIERPKNVDAEKGEAIVSGVNQGVSELMRIDDGSAERAIDVQQSRDRFPDIRHDSHFSW